MTEITQAEVQTILAQTAEEKGHALFFFYTPLCGTCKVTEKMLRIIEEMIPELLIYSCNINLMPTVAQAWHIESVPCILIWKEERVVNKLYAMRDIQHLISVFRQYI